jgi:hypothetical protein
MMFESVPIKMMSLIWFTHVLPTASRLTQRISAWGPLSMLRHFHKTCVSSLFQDAADK